VWTEGGRLVNVPEDKVRALLADLRSTSAGRCGDRMIAIYGATTFLHPAAALQMKVSRLRRLESGRAGLPT